MNCSEAEPDLVDVLRGDPLTPEVAAHLEACPACQLLLEELGTTHTMLGRALEVHPPERIRESFYRRLAVVESEESTRTFGLGKAVWNRRRVFALAGAFVVVFMVGYGVALFSSSDLNGSNSLLVGLEHSLSSERLAAAYTSLSVADSRPVQDALIRALETDPSVNVRIAAVEALTRFTESNDVRNALISSLLSENSPNVQMATLRAIDGFPTQLKTVLPQFLTRTDLEPLVRTHVVNLLEEI